MSTRERMKTTTRVARAKTINSGSSGQALPASSPWLPRWLMVAACMAGAASVTFAVFHYFILSRVPHAMIGTWIVMEAKSQGDGKIDASLKGGTLEFRRDGTMIGKVNMNGKEGTIKATVEVEGKTLRITSVNPYTNRPETDVQTIQILEGDRLALEDRKGTVLTMERLHEQVP